MTRPRTRTDAAGVPMAAIEPGEFWMGSADFYPEEGPLHRVRISGFWMDVSPVTNAQFARFVEETAYVTLAERPTRMGGREFAPGSLVFRQPAGPADLAQPSQWWDFVPGAHWRRPEGTGSSIDGRQDHPVTQVCLYDAQAYAAWRGAQLPTEAQWEYAARGGIDRAPFIWGDEFDPGGRRMANTWRGEFPSRPEGRPGTTPVGAYPANGFGLLDMAGNVWEWTLDTYRPGHVFAQRLAGATAGICCGATATDPQVGAGRGRGQAAGHVLKGGSFLCAPNYCFRARPAARIPQDPDSATHHIGFRCVRLS